VAWRDNGRFSAITKVNGCDFWQGEDDLNPVLPSPTPPVGSNISATLLAQKTPLLV
jgi:hypothetical protein